MNFWVFYSAVCEINSRSIFECTRVLIILIETAEATVEKVKLFCDYYSFLLPTLSFDVSQLNQMSAHSNV